MKTTGTATHCKKTAVIIAMTNNVIFGTLFLKEKSGNFKDIILMLETIR